MLGILWDSQFLRVPGPTVSPGIVLSALILMLRLKAPVSTGANARADWSIGFAAGRAALLITRRCAALLVKASNFRSKRLSPSRLKSTAIARLLGVGNLPDVPMVARPHANDLKRPVLALDAHPAPWPQRHTPAHLDDVRSLRFGLLACPKFPARHGTHVRPRPADFPPVKMHRAPVAPFLRRKNRNALSASPGVHGASPMR
jgi:hypothetical protein